MTVINWGTVNSTEKWNLSVTKSGWILISERCRLGPAWCICIIIDVRAVVLNKKASRLSQIWEQDHRCSCDQLWQSDYNNFKLNSDTLNWWTEICCPPDCSSHSKTRKCVLALLDLSLNCFLVNCLWSKHLRFRCYHRHSSTTGFMPAVGPPGTLSTVCVCGLQRCREAGLRRVLINAPINGWLLQAPRKNKPRGVFTP